MNTADLLRQLEALLITHQDHKVEHQKQKAAGKKVAVPNPVKQSSAAANKKAL